MDIKKDHRESDMGAGLICDHEGCESRIEIQQWFNPTTAMRSLALYFRPMIEIADYAATRLGWQFVPAGTLVNPSFRRTYCPSHVMKLAIDSESTTS